MAGAVQQPMRPVGTPAGVPAAAAGAAPAPGTELEDRLRRVLRLSAPLVEAALRRIAVEVPGYADDEGDGLSEADLRQSFSASFALVVRLLLEQREPTPEELRGQAQLGARRAEAGRELADITRAYRLGFLVIWDGITSYAAAHPSEETSQIPTYASRIWWLHDRICAAMEDAYRLRSGQLRESSGLRARALLDALNRLPQDRAEAERAALAAGLRPEGRFLTAVLSGEQGRRPFLPASVSVEEAGETLVVAGVRVGGPDVIDRFAADLARLGWAHVGVGLCLEGIDGAGRSLRQARRAHQAARQTGRRTVSATSDWFACMVATEEPADPVLRQVMTTLREDAVLAETVSAYLAADRSMTAAAAELFVHPNTVAYRIRRLATTSGLDLRSLDGLVRAYTALTLLGTPPRSSCPA